jgi:hypothetical protein
MKGLLEEVQKKKNVLKPTHTVGGDPNLELLKEDKNLVKEDEIRREYFFQSAVDKWYEDLKDVTFESEFLSMTKEEALTIIHYWNDYSSKSNEPITQIPESLHSLGERIDHCIKEKFSHFPAVFVKLSTRSPKDSKTVFRNAQESFRKRLDSDGNIIHSSSSSSDTPTTSKYNERLIAFSEEMTKANAVHTGREALTILLDSWRVAEDLMYALGLEFSTEDQRLVNSHSVTTNPTDSRQETPQIQKEFSISLVIRGWNPAILPHTEFRGFVWNSSLNCLGQYYHSLYYPQLLPLKEQIANDCLQFFNNRLKNSLPVPNAMLDLVWLGPGNILLIEINPLMEGLGSFKGSTGLFDYYQDSDLLQGKLPFEIRIREEEESRQEMISHMSMEWRKVVYEF